MSKTKRQNSRSDDQQTAEGRALDLFAEILGVTLQRKKRLKIEDCMVEIDGYADGDTIHLVEVWAHVGKAKGAQPKKVLTDVLKMAFAADALSLANPEKVIRKHFVFIDAQAAEVLRGQTWGAAAAKLLDVESHVVAIDEALRQIIIETQRKQDIRNGS